MSRNRIISATSLILHILLAVASSQLQQTGIHLSLIHRDSYHSPLYNTHESSYDRIKGFFVRSKSRLNYLTNLEGTGGSIADIEPQEDGEYLVKFSVGTPPLEMVAVMDMASELILIRCLPCAKCNKQNLPIFDPSTSFTHKEISCNSSQCNLLSNRACDTFDRCSITHGSSNVSRQIGLLGRDVVTFESSTGVNIPIQDVTFGCEHDPSVSLSRYNGVFGLGYHNLSLVMQMSEVAEPKFTYCLGNHSDPTSENRLVLGRGLFLEGETTSLKVIKGRYHLILEGIDVGDEKLDIPQEVFEVSSTGGGGVMIDTHTMLTFLAPEAYYRLVDALERQLQLNMEMWPDPPFKRCYSGKLNEIMKFRGVIFHFVKGLDMLVDVSNLFLQVENNLFCLGVLPSPLGGASVLGSLFQQSYSVGYHLGEMLVSFHRIDCKLLEKHLEGGS